MHSLWWLRLKAESKHVVHFPYVYTKATPVDQIQRFTLPNTNGIKRPPFQLSSLSIAGPASHQLFFCSLLQSSRHLCCFPLALKLLGPQPRASLLALQLPSLSNYQQPQRAESSMAMAPSSPYPRDLACFLSFSCHGWIPIDGMSPWQPSVTQIQVISIQWTLLGTDWCMQKWAAAWCLCIFSPNIPLSLASGR